MKTEMLALIKAAKEMLATRPAFRSKPIGAPHSLARLRQDDLIAAEDALAVAIKNAEGSL